MQNRFLATLLASAALVAFALAPAGCQNSAQTGMLAGAGMGALMGQAIGGNTTGTLIGAGVGLGIGYIIGNEMDKSRAEEMSRANAAGVATAPAVGGGTVVVVPATHGEVGSLGGTRWVLESLNPRDVVPAHVSIVVEFRPNGRVTTTTTFADGSVATDDESYRVVGDTLIINRPGYLVNSRFQVAGSQLVISAERFSAVLRRLP